MTTKQHRVGHGSQDAHAKARRGSKGPVEKFGERELVDVPFPPAATRPTYPDSHGTKPLFRTFEQMRELLGPDPAGRSIADLRDKESWIIHIPRKHTEEETLAHLRAGNYRLLVTGQTVHVTPNFKARF